MFSTTGLFKSIACPEGERCLIVNCMFSHDLRPKASLRPELSHGDKQSTEGLDGRETKRRRLDDSSGPVSSKFTDSMSGPSVTLTAGAFKGHSGSTGPKAIAVKERAEGILNKPPQALQRSITPPPLSNGTRSNTVKQVPAPAQPNKKETLNPRMIPYDPAGHAKRTLLLQHLHEQMKRLNADVVKSDNPNKEALSLTENELIKASLDEEEKLARENSKVYSNVIKNRIGAYKRMSAEDWTSHVLVTFTKAKDSLRKSQSGGPNVALETGLPSGEEYLLLPHLITDQAPLARHGYVIVPPSLAEIAQAKMAVSASLNHEVCDRCKSRFRVFPDRREEDGALTTNGPCVYHWGRPFTPKREKTDAIKGVREPTYSCCNEPLGTKGCTESETHVFKVSEAKRLASVLPFVSTPENPKPAIGPNGSPPAAVTFDCEMGYTVYGLELIRLTAVSWPEGDALIDVLVRPQGAILDFNSRFSGVWPKVYNEATPYKADTSEFSSLLPPPPPGSDKASSNSAKTSDKSGPLPIVASPADARALLCSYITPRTPLIGHALENDLNTVRLCHPLIIDTIVLFPHPRGLPMRFGLKMLSKRHLSRDIQMGGANGHDSLEDARATGDLVRFRVGKRWEEMKRDGWTIKGELLMPPLPHDMPSPPPNEGEKVLGGSAGTKRQRIQIGAGKGEESSAKKLKADE